MEAVGNCGVPHDRPWALSHRRRVPPTICNAQATRRHSAFTGTVLNAMPTSDQGPIGSDFASIGTKHRCARRHSRVSRRRRSS